MLSKDFRFMQQCWRRFKSSGCYTTLLGK